ncbi:MAG: site-2 protease family protein [Chloroflexi bacterium]|nr:site-2 protease family protein [Chloroflexota bacterium]
MPDETMEILPVDTQDITQIVNQHFNILSVTTGGAQQGYFVRYEGLLRAADSETAYDQLSTALDPLGFFPLFRKNKDNQVILVLHKRPEAKLGPIWVNILLFVLTFISVLFTGAQFSTLEVDAQMFTSLNGLVRFLLQGWPFTVSLLGILTAHEFGHYLVGRARGVKVTLPYFIPFPFSVFGTMGAFISMKAVPKNRKHMLEIGIAGPLAGLLVTIPVLMIGLNLSTVGEIAAVLPEGAALFLEGNSLLYLFAKYITFGKLLPQPATFGVVSPVFFWLKYFFTSQPLPLGGLDVQIHPVAWAGWAGLFVTALNLIPAGQLDGGHILSMLLGKERAQKTLPFVLGALLVMGFAWRGWWLWAGLIFFTGRRYAEPLDQITRIDRKHQILGIIALVIFLLIFIPVPLIILQ